MVKKCAYSHIRQNKGFLSDFRCRIYKVWSKAIKCKIGAFREHTGAL